VTAVQTAPGAIPGAPGACQAEPVKDSWYEERSQHPANLNSDAVGAWPVIAVCAGCHGRIRRTGKRQPWRHVPQTGG
jgi:hypothetical protein